MTKLGGGDALAADGKSGEKRRSEENSEDPDSEEAAVNGKREKKKRRKREGKHAEVRNDSLEKPAADDSSQADDVRNRREKQERRKNKGKHAEASDECLRVDGKEPKPATDGNPQPVDVQNKRVKKKRRSTDSSTTIEIEASQAAEIKREKKKRKNQAADDVPIKREKKRKRSSADNQTDVEVGDPELDSKLLAASTAANGDNVSIKRKKKKRKKDFSLEGHGTEASNGAGEGTEGEKLENSQRVDGVQSKREKKKRKSKDVTFSDVEHGKDNDLALWTVDQSEAADRAQRKKKHADSGIKNVELGAKELAASIDDQSQVEDGAQNKREAKKKKKVTFAPDIILNEIPPNKSEEENEETFGSAKILNQGDRPIAEQYSKQAKFLQPYTPEEDEIIRQTVNRYCEDHRLEREEVYRCWTFGGGIPKVKREILDDLVKNLPDRERSSIRRRARFALDIFNKKGKWTEEEVEVLMRLVEEHGRKWAKLESLMNRSRYNLARVWAYRRGQGKKGHYTHEEIEMVTQEVHKALANNIKLGVSKTRRDDIPWQAIATKVPGRPHSHLRVLWYRDLCSPMTRTGEWGSSDDHLLLVSILESGAVDEESIDWDKLLSHRPGEVCKKRWNEMRAHLGRMWQWPLEKKLEVLLKRYAPCFLEPEHTSAIEP